MTRLRAAWLKRWYLSQSASYSAPLKTIPNLLSIARAILAIPLCWCIVQEQHYAALAIIFIAGVTDFLDGYLARRWQVPSQIGEVLDPIADKVFLGATFLTLILLRMIPLWMAVLVLGRDLMILLGAGVMSAFGKTVRRFPPTWWGKASTVAQLCYVIVVVWQISPFLIEFGKWCVIGFTGYSGLDYARRAAYNSK